MIVRSQHKFRALVGVLAIVGLVWAVMPQDYWSRMNTINASEDQRDESAAGRIHFWKIAAVMAKAKPLTGVGLNGFAASYATYDPTSQYGEYRQTHSTWFGVLAELGLPGLADLPRESLPGDRLVLGRRTPSREVIRRSATWESTEMRCSRA